MFCPKIKTVESCVTSENRDIRLNFERLIQKEFRYKSLIWPTREGTGRNALDQSGRSQRIGYPTRSKYVCDRCLDWLARERPVP